MLIVYLLKCIFSLAGPEQSATWYADLEFKTDRRWIFTSKDTFSFHLQACRDVHFFVSTIPFTVNTAPCAEVVFGSNNNQEVKLIPDRPYNADDIHVVQVPNVLDCNRLRDFWISWDGGMLRAGIGSAYAEELISAPHNLINVSAVGTTSAEGVNATWSYSRHQGRHTGLIWRVIK